MACLTAGLDWALGDSQSLQPRQTPLGWLLATSCPSKDTHHTTLCRKCRGRGGLPSTCGVGLPPGVVQQAHVPPARALESDPDRRPSSLLNLQDFKAHKN